MGNLELWLVRHGETDWNRSEKIQGWTDVPLNRTGVIQAMEVGQALQGIPFLHLYASDLARAMHTATYIGQGIGLRCTKTALLRERRFGDAEGLTKEESCRLYAGEVARQEPLSALSRRLRTFLFLITSYHHRGRVIAVTHGGVIRHCLQLIGRPSSSAVKNVCVVRVDTAELLSAQDFARMDHTMDLVMDRTMK